MASSDFTNDLDDDLFIKENDTLQESTSPGSSATEDPRPADPHQPIPNEIPLLPLRDSVVFPGTIMPLKVVRGRIRRAVNAALAGERMLCAVAQRHSDTDDPKLDDLYRVGTACSILRLGRGGNGDETIILQGLTRVGIVELLQETPFLVAVVHSRRDTIENSTQLEALVHSVRINAKRAIELSPHVPEEALETVDGIPTASGLVDFLAANLALPLINKQEMLETFDVKHRLEKVNESIIHQIEILEVSDKIQKRVRSQVDQTQREFYLREELKAIQQELGIVDGRNVEAEKYRRRVARANLPEAAKLVAEREVERLELIPQASPEYSNTIDFLEWICTLPWNLTTEDRLDIKHAEEILDEDHYGLKNIKKRILEFLAVRKLRPHGRGPILCFVGPPGVGKTSLGQSIARALNRKFARIALGGAHDEADIRGHRRTYIGALPGRIIQELRKVASNNPVFMLDEVDKLGRDFRGDPAAALLEVLDPAQNSTFADRYLDVPFDLSRVLFIATANYIDAIPGPLRDRMEVIELPGYTRQEKLEIATRYLVPRQIEENGLSRGDLRFDRKAITAVITDYTREAGVRELERKIGAVCRARAAAIVSGAAKPVRVTSRTLQKVLGYPIFESESASKTAVEGVVTGLAFTPFGGEILFVEASQMPGAGRLNLTGQIGEVMRESAQAAFTVAKNRSQQLKIDPQVWAQCDFHIHVPAGATPKDGPSAGVAMLSSLVSLVTHRAIDPAMGMTGEITLRGAILPVGGIREKVLAAHRARLKRVLLPTRNMHDLDELPAEVRREIKFIPIDTIDALLSAIRKHTIATKSITAPRTRRKVKKS